MMKFPIGHLVIIAFYFNHLLVRGVSGRGEDEEGEKLRPTSEWLDEFYSNIDNVLVEGTLTPSVSDLPDLPMFTPSNNTAELPMTKPPEHDDGELPTTKPPEHDDGELPEPNGRAIGLNILFNADGVPFQGVAPPDPTGDVGTDHYVQSTNGASGAIVRILNKSNGSLNTTFVLDGLGAGGDCANGKGDPIVLFDQFASRWFLSEFSSAGNKLCVYISTSDNAAGTFFRYEFMAPSFPDYPKYGVWNDAYYIGTNEGTPAVYALQRSQMLIGAPAVIVRNAGPTSLGGFGFQMMPPVDADGNLAPPTGPGLFVRHVDDESHNNYPDDNTRDLLEIYTLSVNFATLSTTLVLLQTINVNEFDSNLCGLTSNNCVPQPGSATTLDPLRQVVMNRPQYRNFGTHEMILATWVTDVGVDQHAVRWMELRKAAGPGTSWVIHQQNNFSPGDATNRWMSSGAMNGCGDVAIGYSVSSSTVFPGIRVTGRLSTDALNQLDPAEATLASGAAASSSNRWGDYSQMAVDPIDDYTFWYTNEYIPGPSGEWTTRITKFTLGTDCGLPSVSPTPVCIPCLAYEGSDEIYGVIMKLEQSGTLCTEKCVPEYWIQKEEGLGYICGRC